MTALFIQIFNMSITASWLIVAVILVRILMRKAPKGFRYVLWGMVGIRLICPISLESALSMIPSAEVFSEENLYSDEPEIHTGVAFLNDAVNPILTEKEEDISKENKIDKEMFEDMYSSAWIPNKTEQIKDAGEILQEIIYFASVAWLLGIVGLLLYAIVSYVRLSRVVRVSIQKEDNIWICDSISTPFILGMISPKIYLPSYIEDGHLPYILAHEKEHIKYKDYWWKPLGFLIMSLHWFNPLVWLAYILMCRDIELACDERVISSMNVEEKKHYSESLLLCSNPRHFVSACPVAFGEVGVKERIRKIVQYKKPSVWLVGAAILICIIVTVGFMTNPKEEPFVDGTEDRGQELEDGPLSEEELKWFKEEFFNTSNPTHYLLLDSVYNNPREVDLFKTFYSGMLDEPREYPTKEEINTLIARYKLSSEDIHVVKISTQNIDMLLQKYLDIRLEETDKVGLEKFYYLEEYDAYYNLTADVTYPPCVIESGWRDVEKGIVVIQYYLDPNPGGDGNIYNLTLRETEDAYYFVSNQIFNEVFENSISQEKIEWFQLNFFNNKENPITNQFLSSEYLEPESIDLYELFYNGISGSTSTISENEKQLLLERYVEEIYTDIIKVSATEMNDVLQKYLGLSLEGTEKVNLSFMYYLEEYDAYYYMHGDTNYKEYEIEVGRVNEDGTITLQYHAIDNPDHNYWVRLIEKDGNYYFLSNQRVGLRE